MKMETMRQTITRLTAELGEAKYIGEFGNDTWIRPENAIRIYEFADGTMYGETNADPLTHDECFELRQARVDGEAVTTITIYPSNQHGWVCDAPETYPARYSDVGGWEIKNAGQWQTWTDTFPPESGLAPLIYRDGWTVSGGLTTA